MLSNQSQSPVEWTPTLDAVSHVPIVQIVESPPPIVMKEIAQEDGESGVIQIVDSPVIRVTNLVEESVVENHLVHETLTTIDTKSTAHTTTIDTESTAHSTAISSHKLEDTECIRSVTLGEDERNTEQQLPSPNNEVTVVMSLIHQPETNNPFDFDIVPNKSIILDQHGVNLTPKKGASRTNPFAYDSDSDNLVAAICCEELNCEEGKQEDTGGDGDDMSDEGNSRTWRTSLPMRYNPFDVEGEIEDANDIESLTRQQQSDESSVPFPHSNISRFRHQITTPSSSSSTKSIHTFSKKYAQEIHDLQLWGFDYSLCSHALMHTHGNVDKAKQLMVTHLLDDHRLVSNEQSWTSPVMVSIHNSLRNEPVISF